MRCSGKAQSAEQLQGLQTSQCLWALHGQSAGDGPDLLTPHLQVCRIFSISTACMESMFKMLSQHTVYPQAMPWVFLFLLPTQPCWCLLCFQGLALQLGALPALCSAHCPALISLFHFHFSCEPCYSWLLSHALLWIHTLSLIPSLGCLHCCSSRDRVIQLLGNSHYLSLWMLPALPYFRVISIWVVFHWVDVSRKKKSFKNCCCIIATPTATQQHTQDLCVPESCKTCAICNILTVRATQCKKNIP